MHVFSSDAIELEFGEPSPSRAGFYRAEPSWTTLRNELIRAGYELKNFSFTILRRVFESIKKWGKTEFSVLSTVFTEK